MKKTLSFGAAAALVLVLGAAKCGGDDDTVPSPAPSGGSTPSQTQTGSAGQVVEATDDAGFTFELQVPEPPKAVTSVKVDYGTITHIAPPGTQFITATLVITNPSKDRPAPLDIDPSCCFSIFTFGVPKSQSRGLGGEVNCNQLVGLPDDECQLFTEVASVSPSQQFETSPTIPPGGSVTLVLTTLNEVPTSARTVHLYLTHPTSGDPAVQIPIPLG
jgi:hypothetical protein